MNLRFSLGPCIFTITVTLKAIPRFLHILKQNCPASTHANLYLGLMTKKQWLMPSSFSDSNHILCTRHLRQNVNQKLTDAAVDKADKNMLLDKMFGEDGIINADDTVCFEEKCEEYESLSQSVSEPFLRYFQKRVKQNLNKKRTEPETVAKADKQWIQ